MLRQTSLENRLWRYQRAPLVSSTFTYADLDCAGLTAMLSCQLATSFLRNKQQPLWVKKRLFLELSNSFLLAEILININKTGKNLISPGLAKAIKVQAGDVIGWVGSTSSGALAFEQTIDDPSFFYSDAKFGMSIGGTLAALGGATRYDIKHVLRAHVSQPSQAAVNVNFIGAGTHKVTVIVDNVAESELRTCEVSVQVQCQRLYFRLTSSL